MVAGGVATVRLFVWPPSDSPESVDAVIMLSGDRGERLARSLRLMDAGIARTLVLDGEPDSQQARDLCDGGRPFEVICLRPQPDSTRSEARAAARLASARRWRTVAVVTTTSHITRAGLLFRRCFDGSVKMVKAHRREGVRPLIHEWMGLVHAIAIERAC